MPFDSVRWRRERVVFESDVRERMAADLVRRRVLAGLSRSEVIALLGEGEITDGNPPGALIYSIREDFGHDIDPVGGANLVISFGPQDIVNTTQTVEW